MVFVRVFLFLVLPLKGRANLKRGRTSLWGNDLPAAGALAYWDDTLLMAYPNPKCAAEEPKQALSCSGKVKIQL